VPSNDTSRSDEGAKDGAEAAKVKRTGRRRVSTDAVPGSDPAPQRADGSPVERAGEDDDRSWGGSPKPDDKNDERLKLDKPPHWG
jgi:high-mobility group nucleosome-binding domain-containing protein 2